MHTGANSAASARTILKNSAQGSGGCNTTGVVNLASALGGGGGTSPSPTSTGAIAGTVTSGGKTKTAISGATVHCGRGGSAMTGSNGGYTIASVPVGSYSCTASATGYVSKAATVSVTASTTTTANFALRR